MPARTVNRTRTVNRGSWIVAAALGLLGVEGRRAAVRIDVNWIARAAVDNRLVIRLAYDLTITTAHESRER